MEDKCIFCREMVATETCHDCGKKTCVECGRTRVSQVQSGRSLNATHEEWQCNECEFGGG